MAVYHYRLLVVAILTLHLTFSLGTPIAKDVYSFVNQLEKGILNVQNQNSFPYLDKGKGEASENVLKKRSLLRLTTASENPTSNPEINEENEFQRDVNSNKKKSAFKANIISTFRNLEGDYTQEKTTFSYFNVKNGKVLRQDVDTGAENATYNNGIIPTTAIDIEQNLRSANENITLSSASSSTNRSEGVDFVGHSKEESIPNYEETFKAEVDGFNENVQTLQDKLLKLILTHGVDSNLEERPRNGTAKVNRQNMSSNESLFGSHLNERVSTENPSGTFSLTTIIQNTIPVVIKSGPNNITYDLEESISFPVKVESNVISNSTTSFPIITPVDIRNVSQYNNIEGTENITETDVLTMTIQNMLSLLMDSDEKKRSSHEKGATINENTLIEKTENRNKENVTSSSIVTSTVDVTEDSQKIPTNQKNADPSIGESTTRKGFVDKEFGTKQENPQSFSTQLPTISGRIFLDDIILPKSKLSTTNPTGFKTPIREEENSFPNNRILIPKITDTTDHGNIGMSQENSTLNSEGTTVFLDLLLQKRNFSKTNNENEKNLAISNKYSTDFPTMTVSVNSRLGQRSDDENTNSNPKTGNSVSHTIANKGSITLLAMSTTDENGFNFRLDAENASSSPNAADKSAFKDSIKLHHIPVLQKEIKLLRETKLNHRSDEENQSSSTNIGTSANDVVSSKDTTTLTALIEIGHTGKSDAVNANLRSNTVSEKNIVDESMFSKDNIFFSSATDTIKNGTNNGSNKENEDSVSPSTKDTNAFEHGVKLYHVPILQEEMQILGEKGLNHRSDEETFSSSPNTDASVKDSISIKDNVPFTTVKNERNTKSDKQNFKLNPSTTIENTFEHSMNTYRIPVLQEEIQLSGANAFHHKSEQDDINSTLSTKVKNVSKANLKLHYVPLSQEKIHLFGKIGHHNLNQDSVSSIPGPTDKSVSLQKKEKMHLSIGNEHHGSDQRNATSSPGTTDKSVFEINAKSPQVSLPQKEIDLPDADVHHILEYVDNTSSPDPTDKGISEPAIQFRHVPVANEEIQLSKIEGPLNIFQLADDGQILLREGFLL